MRVLLGRRRSDFLTRTTKCSISVKKTSDRVIVRTIFPRPFIGIFLQSLDNVFGLEKRTFWRKRQTPLHVSPPPPPKGIINQAEYGGHNTGALRSRRLFICWQRRENGASPIILLAATSLLSGSLFFLRAISYAAGSNLLLRFY